MYAIERRKKIIDLLGEKKSLSVQEAAEYFGVVEETIRRDFNILDDQKLLIRTHGGAVALDDAKQELSYELRQSINIEGKDKIGQEAAKLIQEGDTVILDASTSSFFVAKHIKNKKNITVITNAENVITELSNSDIIIISTGGVLRRKSMSYVGRTAEASLSHYHANKLFFSCMGFTFESGLTDSNGQESDMKKIMLACSQKHYFLCDHTKFNKIGYAATAKAENIDVFITDAALDKDYEAGLNALGIQAIIAR